MSLNLFIYFFFVSDSQIYYKVIKEIEPGEELLVYLKEGGYSLGNMAPSMEGKALFCELGPFCTPHQPT